MRQYILTSVLLILVLSGCTKEQPTISNPEQPLIIASDKLQDQKTDETEETIKKEQSTQNKSSTNNNLEKATTTVVSSNQSSSKSSTSSPNKTKINNLNDFQILGKTDLNASFEVIEEFGFNYVTTGSGVHPKSDLTINWTGSSPNFLIRLLKNQSQIFAAYVGNVQSFTFPSSLFTEGDEYIIQLAATNGSNSHDPNYKQIYAQNASLYAGGIYFTIHTLTPPVITSPQNGVIIPKEDLTTTWKSIDWINKHYNNFWVIYSVKVVDLTTDRLLPEETFSRKDRGSYTINGNSLISGHNYSITVKANMPIWGHNYSDFTKSSTITFSVQ